MTTRMQANPECKECKGAGIAWFMVAGEPEKDMCDCVSEVEVEMKRFRGSLYFEINATDKRKALEIAVAIERHIANPESFELPEGYYNPYVGGVGQWIVGDFIGNAERLKGI